MVKNLKENLNKYENIILSVTSISILFLCLFFTYDCMYNLNDDVMIRNILSGSYSGSPSPMNKQILYPFSLLLSSLYKILPNVPWFDLLLFVGQYMCLIIILNGLLKHFDGYKEKLIIIAAYICFVITFFAEHIILITYTVTSGFFAITAIFIFICYDDLPIIKKSIICILLVLLAFCIRTKMMLMLMPFVAIAGVYCWSNENKIFTKSNFIRYFGIFFAIIICFMSAALIHNKAYSKQGWDEYNKFYDHRTTIYDYTGIPKYEENKEFYIQNNISYEQYLLLVSYDFSLDEDINSDMLKNVAEYAQKQESLSEKFIAAKKEYKQQILGNLESKHKIDTLYHTLIIMGYVILLLSISKKNIFKIIIFAAVIFASRSFIWLYILTKGRVPERITHPLYWAEFILLISIFIIENKKNTLNFRKIRALIAAIIITVSSVYYIGAQISNINEVYTATEDRVKMTNALQEYCDKKSDNFYFLTTSSKGILLAEKVFNKNNIPPNMDLAGGWFVKSPLNRQNLKNYGIDNVFDAIIKNNNVYIIQGKNYIIYTETYPFESIVKHYKSKGYDVEIEEVDHITEDIYVYKVNEKSSDI